MLYTSGRPIPSTRSRDVRSNSPSRETSVHQGLANHRQMRLRFSTPKLGTRTANWTQALMLAPLAYH
jgi:hypothetical protein